MTLLNDRLYLRLMSFTPLPGQRAGLDTPPRLAR
jgi:hypothetical protein